MENHFIFVPDKATVSVSRKTIGLSVHEMTGKAKLGSLTRNRDVIETIMKDIFGIDTHKSRKVKLVQTQLNKIRYDFQIDRKEYCEALEELKSKFEVVKVREIGRVMS